MDEASQLIDDFVKTYPIMRFGKGQAIFRPDDDVNRIHYVLEGTVVQYDISETGNVVVVNNFLSGAFLPMSHALGETTIDYFFEADSPVSTRVIPREHVIEFIGSNPNVALDLLKKSYRGSDEIIRRLSYAMGGSATNRAIYELLSAAERIGESNINGSVFIPLSENDIAKRTGLSRETVNRMLRTFKAAGIIHATNQGIEISSLDILRESLNQH